LRLWDRDNARLTLALEQLDRADAEIERLRAQRDELLVALQFECGRGDDPPSS
jgi:hypothetical protein